jgi:capsular exopolysaccharide synthesis family protein
MTDAPKARTLPDYVHFIKRNKWLVGSTVVIVVAVALALSLTQAKQYSASAKLYFPDPLAEAGIVGEQASNTPPAELAAQGVARLTSPATLENVKTALGTSLSTEQIKSDISSVTDPNTFVVTVTTTAPTGTLAAELANAVAQQTKLASDQAASQQFDQVAQSFHAQVKALTPAQRANQAIVSALYDNYSRALALSKGGGAEAAQIQSTAAVPSSPSSPKPTADGIVGLLLGFVLGLIIAGIREAFDRRLRSPKAIEGDLHLPILGHIREEALGKLPTPYGGKPRVDELDLEAFRILRTNLEFLISDRQLRSIAVTSALPEEGKTTIASSLASTLALAGRRTLLVECDLRRPTLSKRLGISRVPGLSDFLTGRATPGEVVRAIRIGVGRNGAAASGAGGDSDMPGTLACITAGSATPLPAELLASARFEEFLGEVSAAYDIVVLDTAPLLPVADTLQLLPKVDAVLLCLRASRTTRDQAISARTALTRVSSRPAGVVLTGVRDRGDYGGYYSYSYYDDAVESAPSGPSVVR